MVRIAYLRWLLGDKGASDLLRLSSKDLYDLKYASKQRKKISSNKKSNDRYYPRKKIIKIL